MAGDVMVSLGDVAHISTEEDFISVMEILEEEMLGVVAVVDIKAMDDGGVIGVVTREHLLELMRTP
jgi:desulfoferrodoxin (superoxide reductase-like protein)